MLKSLQLQIQNNNECLLCLESAKTFNIHDKMNIQFGVRKNNTYYPRCKIDSVFNGTVNNNGTLWFARGTNIEGTGTITSANVLIQYFNSTLNSALTINAMEF